MLVLWAVGVGVLFAQAPAAIALEARQPAAARTAGLIGFVNKIERKQLAQSGGLPLAGTPDLSQLDERLAQQGFRRGSPMLLRVFKAEATVELYLHDGQRFQLFASYPICFWNGDLGPKLRRGDKQSPEGFFTVTADHLRATGHWNRALDLGFPTPYEDMQGHTGDGILIHGGCGSIGCIAMTDPVIEEIYQLARAALKGGQREIPVHVFPFRMTAVNMAAFMDSPWFGFWQELKPAYDYFERSHVPPRVGICDKRYAIYPGDPKLGAAVGVSTDCRKAVAGRGGSITNLAVYLAGRRGLRADIQAAHSRYEAAANTERARSIFVVADHSSGANDAGGNSGAARSALPLQPAIQCSLKLASCRQWVALRSQWPNRRAVALASKKKARVALN